MVFDVHFIFLKGRDDSWAVGPLLPNKSPAPLKRLPSHSPWRHSHTCIIIITFVRHIGHVVTLVMSAQPSHRHLCPHGTHAWDRSANIQMTHCSAVATVDVASDGRGNGADSADSADSSMTV